MTKNKTWKRELGLAFAAMLMYVVWTENVELVKVLVWPTMSFIAAASGMHIYRELQQPRA